MNILAKEKPEVKSDATTAIKHRTVHWFTYRGVTCEVCEGEAVLPDRYPSENWTYYLYLRMDAIADEALRKKLWLRLSKPNSFGRRHFDYYKSDLLSGLAFHGGITYYQQESVDGIKAIKIGCDYQHLWDEGMYYNLDIVAEDAKRTVDDLHNKITYLCWCNGNGKFYRESDGDYIQGHFHSNKYQAAQKEARQ